MKAMAKWVKVAASLGLVLYAMPAMARNNGHGHHWGKGHGRGAVETNSAARDRSAVTTDGDDDTSGAQTGVASEGATSRANEGGAVRGIERSDDVAGGHGAHGRGIASQHGRN